tara:strand:- start:206 stop:619 length:414 start_codon:yes stop_codon:yes gene_type:complete
MNQDTTSIALLEVSSGETTDYTEQEIHQLPFRIGRSANCQLQLSAPAVWAEHLEIDLNEEKRFILRRLSKATAMINGIPTDVVTPLSNDDYVQFGSVTMRFSLGPIRQKNLSLRETTAWTIITVIIISEFILLLSLT